MSRHRDATDTILICLIVTLLFSPKQGKIVVQKPLDREIIPNYTLRVTATDNGNPPRYGETSVSNVENRSFPSVLTVEVCKFNEYSESTLACVAGGITKALAREIPPATQAKSTYTITLI